MLAIIENRTSSSDRWFMDLHIFLTTSLFTPHHLKRHLIIIYLAVLSGTYI